MPKTSTTDCHGLDMKYVLFKSKNAFPSILNQFNLTEFAELPKFSPKEREEYQKSFGTKMINFQWCNPDKSLCIETANNPLTGEHGTYPREKELNYASYMGVYGANPDQVQLLIKTVKSKSTKEGTSKCNQFNYMTMVGLPAMMEKFHFMI